MAKREFKYVGHSVARVDGLEKVTGQAKFVGDITVPGMLYGRILRSTYPHARIRSIDASQAEALPGVVAVLTAADIADLNPIYNGRPVIAMNKVHYIGEPVAAVAAEDLATTEEALSLIHVDYEELPSVVGIEAAIKPGAPLVHDDKAGNIGTHEKVTRGNVDEGFAQSDVIVEDHFTFPMVYHYAMEPHSAIAHYDENEITVWSSAQHPFQVRGDIAKIFKVPAAKVRLIINYLGGGYGSKSYTKFEPLVVALARKAKRPVRICNSVGESMVTVRRHGARVRIKTGAKSDGTIVAREAEIYLDTGGYDDNGPQVTARSATRVLGPYWIPNIRTNAYQVYTNTGSAGSYRAIGAPQVIYAGESQIEILAANLGMDAAELRAKNLLTKGQELRPGLKGIDANLASSLKTLVRESHWKKSLRKRNSAVGMGTAEVDIDRDTGAVTLKKFISVADVGKAIHPEHCVAQEEGAAMQGIGHTFFEQLIYDNGQLINQNLIDYRIPTFSEVPEEFHTVLVENGDGPGPYGVRGMAEGGILSVAPAVCNAIDRATGVRIRDLPLTPERVWRALRDAGK